MVTTTVDECWSIAAFVVPAQDMLVDLDLQAYKVTLELLEPRVLLVLGDLLGYLGFWVAMPDMASKMNSFMK